MHAPYMAFFLNVGAKDTNWSPLCLDGANFINWAIFPGPRIILLNCSLHLQF